ncbi:MAG: TetM/TetW/TetO/TetS family tetracycline resistance ribosomal protection protein [Lachnospiraceae bacterium]|nr:TetM/TetW/TetO/TetS family tetracycline resistance ribosomal protection protein [Lachnospiraceae bacterium]
MSNEKRSITVGVLAHVDAGKTTLLEGLLYESGTIRTLGRVDHRDTFLDTQAQERKRGITIYSKQAVIERPGVTFTFLDTPGHTDFSAEMERTLQVLDYAVLIVSGADGIQGHTMTLWHLLKRYEIPVFIFVNKMDQRGTDKEEILSELKNRLSFDIVDFDEEDKVVWMENVATSDNDLMERFLEEEAIETDEIRRVIMERKLFPCYMGSALKLDGVDALLKGLEEYTCNFEYPKEFGARVFKVTRDDKKDRLTHIKITGGSLKAREVIGDEKVNQIRIYSGDKYTTVNEVFAGDICAITGLSTTRPGDALGGEVGHTKPLLEPVLTYKMELPGEVSPLMVLPDLKQLEEEEPELHIIWNERLQEIQVQIMGEVQLEILRQLILERFALEVNFVNGNIMYKETILDKVEGVGHYEPLKHYAEVHLLMEPAEEGSGIELFVDCSEDVLDRNWQRLILKHIVEKEHIGVLTGSPITDIRFTLVTGKAHLKHTEGGDFRQATYRAIRHGLRQAKSRLLEPYYSFHIEIPRDSLGRCMTDLEQMHAEYNVEELAGSNAQDFVGITGVAPVSGLRDYPKEIISYTKGFGQITYEFYGYGVCHNEEEVIAKIGYDVDSDLVNTADSVFCAHGGGFVVPWDEVTEHMHLESVFSKGREETSQTVRPERKRGEMDLALGTDEIDAIIDGLSGSNRKMANATFRKRFKKRGEKKTIHSESAAQTKKPSNKEQDKKNILLVDGYNIIFSWNELNALAKDNIDGARGKLMDILCNYQGAKNTEVILVFDAYRVKNHETENTTYHNIRVVYTKEAETADQFIEKFAHNKASMYNITVATSDGIEQIIIRSKGCFLMSAKDLEQDVKALESNLKEEYTEGNNSTRNRLFDNMSRESQEVLETLKEKG